MIFFAIAGSKLCVHRVCVKLNPWDFIQRVKRLKIKTQILASYLNVNYPKYIRVRRYFKLMFYLAKYFEQMNNRTNEQ
jgi:hypothetical protein